MEVKQAFLQWQKMYQSTISRGSFIPDPYLIIDVTDQASQPLKTANLFEQHDCEACKCEVFRFYFRSNIHKYRIKLTLIYKLFNDKKKYFKNQFTAGEHAHRICYVHFTH